MRFPACWDADADLGVWGTDGYVADDFGLEFRGLFLRGLEEFYVNCACAGAELYVFDFKGCRTGCCPADEGKLEGDW